MALMKPPGEATVVNIKLDAKDMPAKDLEAFLPALGIHLPKRRFSCGRHAQFRSQPDRPDQQNWSLPANVGLFNGGARRAFDLGSRMASVASLAGIKSGKDLNIEKAHIKSPRRRPRAYQAENFLAVLPTIGESHLAQAQWTRRTRSIFKMLATLTKRGEQRGKASAGRV